MSHHQDSHRWQFEELQELVDQGEDQAARELFEKLLRSGPEIFDSLTTFIIEHPNAPRLAVLLELYAKLGDPRAVPILMRFLEVELESLDGDRALLEEAAHELRRAHRLTASGLSKFERGLRWAGVVAG